MVHVPWCNLGIEIKAVPLMFWGRVNARHPLGVFARQFRIPLRCLRLVRQVSTAATIEDVAGVAAAD
jgi:hypothetical protein